MSEHLNMTLRPDAFLTKVDPRIKLFLFPAFSIMSLFLPVTFSLKHLFFILILVIIIVLSGIPTRIILARTLIILPTLLVITILQIILSPLPEPEKYGIIFNISFKSWFIIICLFVMVATTKFDLIIKCLNLWRVPSIISTLFFFTYRYLYLFLRDGVNVKRAMDCRCCGSTNRILKIKQSLRIIPFLIIKILRRSENIHIAMVSRGFSKRLPLLRELKATGRDYLFAAIFGLAILIGMIIP